MIIILVLSEQSNSSLSVVWIEFRHVYVINEIDELEFSYRSIISSCLLFELLLQNCLKEGRISIIIEVDNLLNVLISHGGQVIQETTRYLCLATPCISN